MKKIVAILVMVTVIALSACSVAGVNEKPTLGGKISGIAGFGEGTQVKLLSAKVIPTGFQTYDIKGNVEVQKGSAPQVVVHYVAPGVNGNENWYDVNAVYVKDSGDKEIWAFVIEGMNESVDPDGYARFAVKYIANGTEYWDNNGGYDYWLSFDDMIAFGKDNVELDYAYYTVGPSYNPYPPQFTGYVYVKDLFYEKDLTIKYTTNNWVDVIELKGHYQSEEGLDGEVWWFSVVLPYAAANVEFAVNYSTPANNDWDNNLGDNYIITGSETVR